jgi:poly-gamma-glutamate synthesis protein (capsule biosynthesis protein)
LTTAIKKAKELSDIVVVMMHAGSEYTRKITTLQENFSRTAIDNGADVVIGSHPHWIQPIERYKGKYIFYSLGNFVFDQEFSPETKSGLTLKIFLKKTAILTTIEKIELIPIIIENYGQPRLANKEEKRSILLEIQEEKDILFPL